MKLVTFEVATPLGPASRLGCLVGDRVLDLHAACARLLAAEGSARPYAVAQALVPPDMLAFLEGEEDAMDYAREALSWWEESKQSKGLNGETLAYPLGAVRLKAPLPRPASLRDFFAFEDHAKAGAARRKEEFPKEWHQVPAYYKGNPREIYGPDEEIPWPSYTKKLDFELEVACVVGRKGRNLGPEEAAGHIAGYMLLNDFSARDIQKKEMVLRMGPAKGKDFATAVGPWLVTADEFPHGIKELHLEAWLNGEKLSAGDFKDQHWGFPLMLSHVSQEETVYPGDVLGSGTYHRGCGLDLDRWIQPGDEIELRAEILGTLKNKVGTPKAEKELDYSRRESSREAA